MILAIQLSIIWILISGLQDKALST